MSYTPIHVSLTHRLRIRWLVLFIALLFLLVPQTLWAQGNRPPQVEPVADRAMYLDDMIRISITATDPDEFDTVRLIEVPSLQPLPDGAELFSSGDGSGFVDFTPTAVGVYPFAIVAEDDGEPQGRTAVFFTVTVKEKPANFADLAIETITVQSSASDGEVHVGDPFDYMIDVKNQGEATLAAEEATLTIFLPIKLSLQTIDDACAVQPPSIVQTKLICTFGTIPAGESRSVHLTLLPKSDGIATNQLFVDTTTLDPITVNDSELSSIEIEPPLLDLAVTNLLLDGDNNVGDTATFRVTVRNNSRLTAHFSLEDTLSAGLTVLSAEGTGTLPCTHSEHTINCESSVIALGNVIYTIVARITQQGEQTAAAVVTGYEADPDVSNNTSAARFSALAVADLRVELAIVDAQAEYEVGDLVFTVLKVEAPVTTYSIFFKEVTVSNAIPAGLIAIKVDPPVDVDCTVSDGYISCTNRYMLSGDSFAVPVVLYAVAPGLWQDHALVTGLVYSDTTPGNNEAQRTINVVEPILPWVYIHTFNDRNGNGRQDPGEESLPGTKIDATTTDGQKSKLERGSTDNDGLIKLPILEEPSQIRVNVRITQTQSITPAISVKINAVPPTGVAKITGGSSCGMTVYDSVGETITLPCTETNTLQWVNQVNASVANFAAKLLPPLGQMSAAGVDRLEPIAVSFEITARENHTIYLPVVAK